jgi:NAD(P)-dependent dehydrogenase (short-subunit alcohol dehydrogenase family)
MNPFDLTGKVAIVTGSSKGIGRGIAEGMAAQGAKVVISSRKVEPCQAVAEEIRAKGGQAAAIACHVGRKDDVAQLIEATHKQFGPVDILVCNAAANPYYGPLLDMPDDAYHKTMDTNVLSPMWLIHAVLPDMKAKKDGAIILVSSVGSLKGSAALGAYAMSKAALNQLARNLALELGPFNIRVNALLPGLVKTDFAKALWSTPQGQQRIKAFPLGRVGEPEDIAPAAVYLASPGGRWTTGQTIVVDGGATIQG